MGIATAAAMMRNPTVASRTSPAWSNASWIELFLLFPVAQPSFGVNVLLGHVLA